MHCETLGKAIKNLKSFYLFTASPEHEKKSIEWVQWLVKEEAYFER